MEPIYVPVGTIEEAEDLIRKLETGANLITIGDRLVQVVLEEEYEIARRLARDWIAIRDEHSAQGVIE